MTRLTPYDSSIQLKLKEMWSCICKLQQGEAGVTPAVPTNTVGLAAKPGVLTSYMRSDGAPAIDQTINPIWIGIHTFGANPQIKNVMPTLDYYSPAGNNLGFLNFGDGAANVPGFLSAITSDQFRVTVGIAAAATFTFGNAGQFGVGNPVSFGTAGQVLTSGGPTGALSWTTASSGAAPANPSGLIGMTAVNGVATTYQRSDSRQAIDPAIAPIWTGNHTFTSTGTALVPSLGLKNAAPVLDIWNTAGSGDQKRWGFQIANTGNFILRTYTDAGVTGASGVALQAFRSGANITDVELLAGGTAKVSVTPTSVTIVSLNAIPVAQATSVALTTAQSGAVFHNTGAAASITYTLPAAAVGLTYNFVNVQTFASGFTLSVRAVGADIIKNGTGASPAAGAITSDAQGENCKLVCITAGEWTVFNDQGGVWTPGA